VITPYYRPQHRIFQNLRNTASNAIQRNGVMVVGTQYLIALNDGRDLPTSPFSSAGGDLLYRHFENGVINSLSSLTHKVKADSVQLFGADLEAAVATNILNISRDGADDRLRCNVNLAGPSLSASLNGRAVRVGDVFVVSADNVTPASNYVTADTVFTRKVKALLPKKINSSVAATTGASNNAASLAGPLTASNNVLVASSAVAPYTITSAPTIPNTALQKLLATGGRFNGKLGEEITMVCTSAGTQGVATFAVSYTALGETEVITTVNATSNFAATFPKLGGAVITLVHPGVAAVGDTLRIILYPIHANDGATMFAVSNPTAYTGTSSTAYVIEVVKGGLNDGAGLFPAGTSLRVYDTNGLEPIQTINLTAAQTGTALGTRGLLMNINTSAVGFPDLATGDKFVVAVTASSLSATEFDGVVLDGPAVNFSAFDAVTGRLSVDIRQTFTGEITSANAGDAVPFTVSDDKVTYDASLGVVIATTVPTLAPFISGRGTLKVAFKAGVKPAAVEGPVKVTSRAAISAGQLGELHIENDLAYGAYQALGGLGGQLPIHVLRTAEDTLAAFEAALRKIRGTDIHYAINPLTDSIETANAVALHCEEMSSPENMNFRRSYFGTDSPGQYTLWDKKNDGNYRKATLVGDLVTVDAADAAVSNFTSAIAPTYVGDIIRFLSLSEDLVVTEVVSSTSVRVSGAPPTGVPVASSFQLIKPDTADNTIDFVISRSLSVENRRAVNVWCDRPTALINGETTVVPSKFLASEISGLRCALRPQQGLTMTEVAGIDEAPAMYARFTPEQLDRCAAAGVLIVTQEIEGGEIFIRHQLTTQTDNGALQYEDNPGVVVDTFSFRIKDQFRGYLGKKNVTPATLAEIYADLKQLAIEASQVETTEDESVGALILGFSDESGQEGEVTVAVDGDLADKVRTFVNLRVALPLNGLTHYVDASASVTI
jgi:hypothetical protein